MTNIALINTPQASILFIIPPKSNYSLLIKILRRGKCKLINIICKKKIKSNYVIYSV